jgi:heptaprenylglyceryl phosphate synthase
LSRLLTDKQQAQKEVVPFLRPLPIEAKNKAAKLGADSIMIIGSDDVSTRAALNSRGSAVMVEALDCN